MNREILYHQSIQKEIREILQHYESISPELADDFWKELTLAFEYLVNIQQGNTTIQVVEEE